MPLSLCFCINLIKTNIERFFCESKKQVLFQKFACNGKEIQELRDSLRILLPFDETVSREAYGMTENSEPVCDDNIDDAHGDWDASSLL